MRERTFSQVLEIIKDIEKTDKDGEIAKRLGVDRATFWAWKKRDTISPKALAPWCHARGKTVDWLLYALEESDAAAPWISEYGSPHYGANADRLDERVLSFVIQGLEKALEDQNEKLSPKIKGAIIARLYKRKMKGQELGLADIVSLMRVADGAREE